MFRLLGSAALAAFLAGSAHAADAQKFAFCQGNPELNHAGFKATFVPEDGGPTLIWHFAFHHCSFTGRSFPQPIPTHMRALVSSVTATADSLPEGAGVTGPPLEIQRYYADDHGNGLGITTQMGSLVSSVRLLSMVTDRKPHWQGDVGLYFTSELLSGLNNNFYRTFLSQSADKSGQGVPGYLKIETMWE